MQDDEEVENKTCGCDCDNCMKGDHQACQTGLCKYKSPDTPPEAPEQ